MGIMRNAHRQLALRFWLAALKSLAVLAVLGGTALTVSGRAHAQSSSEAPPALATTAVKQGVSTACVPGIQIICPCLGGGQGVQECMNDGSRFEPCQCPSARSDATASDDTAPPTSAPAPPTFERRSTAMMVIGIVSLGVGAVTAAIGTVLAVTAIDAETTITCLNYSPNPPHDCSEFGGTTTDDRTKMAAGGVLIGGGGALLAGGTALVIVGAQKVRSKPREQAGTCAPRVVIQAIPARLTVRF